MSRRYLLTLCIVLSSCAVSRGDDAKNDGMQGVWLPVTAELGGQKFPDAVLKTIKLEVKGDEYLVMVGTQPDRGTCKLVPSAKTKSVDITGTDGPNKGKTFQAIYERNGDTLKVCYDLSGKSRPTEFKDQGRNPVVPC